MTKTTHIENKDALEKLNLQLEYIRNIFEILKSHFQLFIVVQHYVQKIKNNVTYKTQTNA